MNAVGMNTAARMSAIATTGPDTSSIALSVASRGDMPSSMWCSTASTTTMASSTTRPMASTRPKSESVLTENPNSGKEHERADERDRHGQQRDQRRPPALQEDEDDEDDQEQRLPERVGDLAHALGDGLRRVERHRVVQVLRESAA